MTKETRLLEYLETNETITSLEAFKKLGDTRLSATIFELRQRGYTIEDRWVEKKNRFGDIRRFKEYYLVEEN